MFRWCWLVLAAAVSIASDAHAEDPRVAVAHQAYVARCTSSLVSQGMTSQKAEAVCACVSKGIIAEVQFGVPGDKERYERIMSAQPNPNGSSEDHQLYKIVTPCFAL